MCIVGLSKMMDYLINFIFIVDEFIEITWEACEA